jgi:hypothetical protein
MIFGFKGGYPARFVRSPMRGYTMHGYKASKKIDTQKRNDQLLSLGLENISCTLKVKYIYGSGYVEQHTSDIHDKVSDIFGIKTIFNLSIT